MSWEPPQSNYPGEVLGRGYHFWVQGFTHGKSGKVYLDGRLLEGVTAVKTEMSVDGATTVTITFVAKSLNEGRHP